MGILEKQFADLRRQRNDIRARLRWAERAISDPTDRLAFTATQRGRLAATDVEFATLARLLGQEHIMHPAVKLDVPPKARTVAVPSRQRAAMPYLTRMLGGG